MAYVHMHTQEDSGVGRRSLLAREDSTGKVWLQVLDPGNGCTAQSLFVLKLATCGYVATERFDTGLASSTATSRRSYYLGVPDETIGSGSVGWFQIGGEAWSVNVNNTTGTAGYCFRWSDESVTSAAGSDIGFVADFAMCLTSASGSTAHDMFLFGRPVCGNT